MSVGVNVQVLETDFDVKNFEATCTVKSLRSSQAGNYVELLSPPIHGAEGHQFHISVGWLKKVEQSSSIPDPDSKFGLKLHLSPSAQSECDVKFIATLVNVDPSKNVTRQFTDYRTLKAAEGGRGWGPDLDPQTGVGPLISEIRNPTKGWLHEGTLRISAKILLATDDQNFADVKESANPHKALMKDMHTLFSTGSNTDVVIKVKGEEIRAHALILMARSSVFAAMLSSPMQEGLTKEILINDLEKSVVEATVSFLYSGDLDPNILRSDDVILGILEAAHRYNVPSLVELCVQTLLERLDVSTVAQWFCIADLIGSLKFKTRCLDFIRLHISEVQGTTKFAEFIGTRPALMQEILTSLFPPRKKPRIEEIG